MATVISSGEFLIFSPVKHRDLVPQGENFHGQFVLRSE